MKFNADKFHTDVFWCAQWVDNEECEECGGTGETMHMVCYGGPPIEKYETCEFCEGNGQIVQEPKSPFWLREYFSEVTI